MMKNAKQQTQNMIDVSSLEYQFIEMGDDHPDEDEIVKREDELIKRTKELLEGEFTDEELEFMRQREVLNYVL